MTIVSGSRVLIVEDEYFIATELERFLVKLGATVLGPASSIERAADYLDDADAAILDIRLDDTYVFPFADQLANRHIPFVFYTGCNDIAIPDRFRYASYLSKPAEAETVYSALRFALDPGPAAKGSREETVFSALPQLRLAARLHLNDPHAADRLVELTLQEAIDHARSKPHDVSINVWLGRLMETIHRDREGKLLS
ncbi:response regulator [Shinella curvata]|uniref:Response regulator n=1 Tax=Shinella curvata TaxID=1817964 RepID=A0ABT8XKH9_9HYPH|nr:response regulator [Shinella curvata]